MSDLEETSGKKQTAVEAGVMVLLLVVFMSVSLIIHRPFGPGADTAQAIGIILAAGLTLTMYSFLYRDNPFFKIAENLYVGVALGYLAITTWRTSLYPDVYEPFFNAPTWGPSGTPRRIGAYPSFWACSC